VGVRRLAVHARVSTFEGPLDQIDEGLRYMREQILPTAFEDDEGFKGVLALADRQSGKTLTITFWESEVAMRATEEEANRLRGELAQAGGETIAAVERYEVSLFEVER
jgi:heme-degrading monooxygenase HmoA